MKIKALAFVLALLMLLPLAVGCNDTEGTDTLAGTDTETESVGGEDNSKQAQNLRVLSFNVRQDLVSIASILNGVSKNRVQAVREQILSYEPDLIGLQEDIKIWVDNIGLKSKGYTEYLAMPESTSKERCAIYVKNGIEVVENGYKWLTRDGTEGAVALSYAELTDGDGKYDMSFNDLLSISVVNDASLRAQYTDSTKSWGAKINSRLMNYVVLRLNGEDVIYVNTHLQHRGYSTGEYTDHPLYMLRYYERCAQFDIVCKNIEEIKQRYPNASVVITGDMNDSSYSGFYDKLTENYKDSLKVAAKGTKLDHSWNSAFKVENQGQGYVSNDEHKVTGRLDYCLVSADLEDCVTFYQVGKTKWTLAKAEGTDKENVDVYPSDHLPIVVDLAIK